MIRTGLVITIAIAAGLVAAGTAIGAEGDADCPAVGVAEPSAVPPGDLPECAPDETRIAEVQAFSGRWVACYEAQDAACMAGLYLPDAVVIPLGGMPLRGSAAIEAYFAGLFLACPGEGTAALTLAFDSIDATEERALVVQQWRAEATVDDEAVQRSGRTMLTLRRDADGAWKIQRQMDADLLAPATEECPAIM